MAGQTVLAPLNLGIQGGKTTGLLLGAGTSANPYSNATADKNDIQMYTKRTATSGTTRQYYGRLDINGAGGDAECIRARAMANVAGVTGLVGGSFTAQLGATAATVTGLSAGVRSSIDLSTATAPGGTFYGALIESISAANSQAPTVFALLGLRSLANGAGSAGTKPTILAVIGDAEGPVGTGSTDATLYQTGTAMTITGALKVLVNGTAGRIPVGTIRTSGGLLDGGGTTSTPLTTATNSNFQEYFTACTATSGDSRQYYGRHDLNAAGVNGEAIRARIMAKVPAVGDAVGGSFTAQVSGATSTIAGLAAGVRATLDTADATLAGGVGEMYGLLVEHISATNSQTWTKNALIGARTIANGGGNAGTKCITFLALGDTAGAVTTGTGDTTMLKTGGTFGVAGGIGVLINGVRAYIPYGSIST